VGNRTGSQNEYDPFNRLVASSRGSYSYDNNGNQTGGPFPVGQGNYVYDFENRLTLATQTWHAPFHHSYTNSVHYSYDALGRRIKRSSSQSRTIGFSTAALTKFVYDGQDVVRDLNEDDSVAAEYLNGPGIDNKLRQTNGQTNYYFTSDHLGSTRALTNDDGEVVEEIAYDSFGNSTGSSITRYTYTGREFDSDTHLYYYRARFYDPHIGRFISEDPIGFRSGDVDLYAYVKNRPLLYRDPTGLQRCDPVVGALIGAGAGGVVGIIGGTLLGPAAGAAVGVLIGGGGGSVVGPEGTVVGGVGGGGLGAVAGAAIGPYVGGGIGAGIGAFIGHRICSGGDTPCDTYPRAVPQPTPSSDPMPPPPPPGGGDDKCVVAYEACLAWATQAATPSEARLRRRLCGQAYDRCKAGGVTVKFPDGSVVR
jgi:RHS repeat-associated protein